MGLLNVLRIGIKTANDVLKDLQAEVRYRQVIARDAYGAPSRYGGVYILRAIVDFKSIPVRNKEGITVSTSATITFLDLAKIEEATGGLGVDYDDEFTLANGSTTKVLNIGGFMDAGTTRPLPTTVYVG